MLNFHFILLVSLIFSLNAEDKHLFILSGQSNMANLDPSESFSPTIEKEFGKKNVIVVKLAASGQPIRRWYKNWKDPKGLTSENNGDLYLRLIGKVKKSIEGEKIKTVTFLWMQGERDAKEKYGPVYKKSLIGIIQQLKLDLTLKQINVVIGRLSDSGIGKKSIDWDMIRKIQTDLVDELPNAAWVNTDDLNDGTNRKGRKVQNDLHYTKDGYTIFGKRLAEQAIHLIQKSK